MSSHILITINLGRHLSREKFIGTKREFQSPKERDSHFRTLLELNIRLQYCPQRNKLQLIYFLFTTYLHRGKQTYDFVFDFLLFKDESE